MTAVVNLNTVYFPRRPGSDAANAVPEPVPYVLTEADLIRFTRLDETASERPGRTLARYRDMGLLRGVQVGPNIRYTLPEALEFLERLKELNPV